MKSGPWIVFIFLSAAFGARSGSQTIHSTLAPEMEQNLQRHVIAPWFPRAVDDELGGFRQGFDEEWKPTGTGRERSIVYQSRLTWFASQLARPDRSDRFLKLIRHGTTSLEALWDNEMGGFFWGIDASTRTAERGGEKHAYGISFGVYASASAHYAAKDKSALDLAIKAFKWLDKHAHDDKNGGYYEALARDGKPIMVAQPHGPNDLIGTRYGHKSMNTHIHLLEAFAELYHVSKDSAVRKRLEEVFKIVRDKIYVDPGCLNLYFTPDWRPVPDHDSYGHDVETAYLLVEAAKILGKPNDSATWRNARNLVDHALQFGWDDQNGGFYDHGTAFGPPANRQKIWWTQAEGLNALLLMHERFGKETPRYWNAFLKQWQFIKEKQTDSRHSGWFPEVTPEGARIPGREKSNAWTDPYHQGRALLNCISALKRTGPLLPKSPAPPTS
jgi:mannobiose 2-epimerase